VSFAVSLSQLALAVVFAIAGAAKLADRAGTGQAIEDFGVASRFSPALSLLLPIVELAIAAALLPAASARIGALAAIALLATFSLGITRTLRAGTAPDCNCFGGLTQTKVGRGSLVRNLLLAGLAGFVAFSPGVEPVSAFHWLTVPAAQDRPAIAFLIACVAGLSWFCWSLLRQNGRLLLRLENEGAPATDGKRGSRTLPPLEIGTPAPAFAGLDLRGERVSLDSLLALGRPLSLLFTDPGCGACETVLDDVARAQSERGGELTVAVISTGEVERVERKAAEHGLDRVLQQADESLLDAYGVNGVPAMIEIDAAGAIAAAPALGAEEVRAILRGSETTPREEVLTVVAR
jgi:peroxiredoxin